MPVVDFSQYLYCPDLLSSDEEHLGYRRLDGVSKESVLPIFSISYRRGAMGLSDAQTMIAETVPHQPFVLDLSRLSAPPAYQPKRPRNAEEAEAKYEAQRESQEAYDAELTQALDPTDGFSNWRNICARFPNAAPMLAYTDPSTQGRQILRQAAMLGREGNSLAIRLTPEGVPHLLPIVSQILSVLESEDQLLIVLDCGQGRQRLDERASFARDTAAAILGEAEIKRRSRLRFVCMSSSFPRSLSHDGLRQFENLDWEIWSGAVDVCPMAFGDYGANTRTVRPSTYISSDWRPTVVFCNELNWLVYRHPNSKDRSGWAVGSTQIAADSGYDPSLLCWGHDILKQAASGNKDANRTLYWYAAKINMHITRQAKRVSGVMPDDDSDQ